MQTTTQVPTFGAETFNQMSGKTLLGGRDVDPKVLRVMTAQAQEAGMTYARLRLGPVLRPRLVLWTLARQPLAPSAGPHFEDYQWTGTRWALVEEDRR